MPRHIEQRRLGWYAVLNVPTDAQKSLRRKRYRVSLKTRDKKVAERLAKPIVAEWQRQIALARGEGAAMSDAKFWRDALRRSKTPEDRMIIETNLETHVLTQGLDNTDPEAQRFYGEAFGTLVSTTEYLEEWIGSLQVKDKTVCIVGVGGIGQDVGKLCSGVGMRVIGTRRSASVPPEGFASVYTPDKLIDILPEADFISICCQWTPETEGLIGKDTLGAMKDGAVICNLARGEIIDEPALKDALKSGRIRGVGLDVYVGEFEHLPDPELWADDRVLFTPHVSAGTDVRSGRQIDLFCRNLLAYIAGKPLENVLDWKRGY